MFSAIIAFILALGITAGLTPLVRRVALAVGAVDAPTARRVHTRRIPRMGGIAIVLGFFIPLVALFALGTSSARIFFSQPRVVGGLFIGSLIIAGLGLCDDIINVGAKRKLAIQVAAAAIAYASGLRIDGISLPWVGPVSLGLLAFPATLLWFCAIVNALNLIDGLDGLAAGVGFFACLTNVIVAFMGHNFSIALLSVTLGGAILGFLIYNFNPAKIFMGDCGSMFLGFSLAAISLLGAGTGTQKAPTLVAILVPVVALGLPIMDMLFAIVRRFVSRRSIFSADRGHIHHRLLDSGLTHRRAVLVLYGLSLAFTVVALLIHLGRSWEVGLALATLTVMLFVGVRFVGAFSTVLNGRRPDPLVEGLRRGIPETLPRILNASHVDDIPELLERFGSAYGLLAIEARSPQGSRLGDFRWESSSEQAGLREAVSAKFVVIDATSNSVELEFFIDSPEGAVGPQAHILLQLVADAVEHLLQRTLRARAATATGRLRPVS